MRSTKARLNPLEQFCLSCCRDEDKVSFVRLPSEWVISPKEKKLVKFVRDYFLKHSQFPPEQDVKDAFSIKGDYEAAPDYYLKVLQDNYVKFQISQYLPKVVNRIEEDPIQTLSELRSYLNNIRTRGEESLDVVYSEDASDRYSIYTKRRGTGGIVYMSTGSEVLDDLILGFEKTDLITFGGRAGTQKTWLLLALLIGVERTLPEDFGPLLLITNEMSAEQITERLDCLRFQIPYDSYIRGELTRKESVRLRKGLKELQDTGAKIIVVDGVATLEELEEKLVMYAPSGCFVDGSYLLEPQMEEGYTKTVFITRNLKSIAKRYRIPVINTTQLRKNKGKTKYESSADSQDDFYHGSYTQDSDFAFRMYRTPKMEIFGEVGMQIAKGRRVAPGTLLKWTLQHSTMINYFDKIDTDADYDEDDPII